MKTLIAFLLCVGTFAFAGELDIIPGIGIGTEVIGGQAFERLGSIGVRYGNPNWKAQANGGYYFASSDGQISSFYTSLQGGLEVVGESGVFATFLFGPAYIAEPDSKLSGHLQFHMSGGLGIKNKDNYGIGILWTHFSNAGIVLPNRGRDIFNLQLTLPIGSF